MGGLVRWLTLALGAALLAWAVAGCRPAPARAELAAPCEYNGRTYPLTFCDQRMADEVKAQEAYTD